MSGIYIHIPFCKQACHYCDFHFSTSLKKKSDLVDAICKELVFRKTELKGDIKTVYFGGGTPSLLTSLELKKIFQTIFSNYSLSANPEITLEANPDDLTDEILFELSESPVNRLSIGVQSFFDEDLKFMNRAHSSEEALNCLMLATTFFDNISIDLIYGIPGLSRKRWQENVDLAMSLNIPHLSCYALTVEPKTTLAEFIRKGSILPIDEKAAEEQYIDLLEMTELKGYDNYEFSNFGLAGYQSQNNTAYWQGKSYLGIGPSAHSFDGNMRSWNVSNNSKYIKSIEAGLIPFEREILTKTDKYNEYIMTGLRTKWGVSLLNVEAIFGSEQRDYLLKQAKEHLENSMMQLENDVLTVTKKGKFLSDGIASSLFLVNLDRNN